MRVKRPRHMPRRNTIHGPARSRRKVGRQIIAISKDDAQRHLEHDKRDTRPSAEISRPVQMRSACHYCSALSRDHQFLPASPAVAALAANRYDKIDTVRLSTDAPGNCSRHGQPESNRPWRVLTILSTPTSLPEEPQRGTQCGPPPPADLSARRFIWWIRTRSSIRFFTPSRR